MKPEVFKQMLEIVKALERLIIGAGTLGLLFEHNRLEGVIYKNELGYCSFGVSDGDSYVVDTKDFFQLCSYLDVLEARKEFKDKVIELKQGDKTSVIGILGTEKDMQLSASILKKGNRIELNKGDVFSLGDNLEYYLLGDQFYFDSLGTDLFGRRKLQQNTNYNLKLTPAFVRVFEHGSFEKIKIGDQGCYFFNDDFEVFLYSGVEGYEETLSKRFECNANKLKSSITLCVDDEIWVKNFIIALHEMRSVGADLIRLNNTSEGMELSTHIRIGLKRRLHPRFRGHKLDGYIRGITIDVLYKLREHINQFMTDNHATYFCGPEMDVLCQLTDEGANDGK